MKQRLDQALVERGLARTRSQARDIVKRGCVNVAGRIVTKAGLEVSSTSEIAVMAGAQPWVSRGGLKLAAALDAFGFEAAGRVAIDVGAATGGFTEVLLARGARRVIAVDVGSRQLAPELATDPRVTNLQGTDARTLDRFEIGEPVDAIVADVSFVSLTQALPVALGLAVPGCWLAALIKPQFEAGRQHIGKGGIVRDDAARAAAVARVRTWLEAQPGWRIAAIVPSPIAGGSGNLEFLIGASFDG